MRNQKKQTTLFSLLGIVASAVASAALLVLAFPPYDYWFLAWVALAPLFAVMALPTPRPRAARAAAALTYVLFMGVAAVAGVSARPYLPRVAGQRLSAHSLPGFAGAVRERDPAAGALRALLLCACAGWSAGRAGAGETLFLAPAARRLDADRVRALPLAAWPYLGKSLHDAAHGTGGYGSDAVWRPVAAHVLHRAG